MRQAPPRVVIVAGPTASGKSDLALALAETLGGVVVNADSQQRYRAFPILTAQPSARERRRAPHVLFGDLPAHEHGAAPAWAAKAAGEIAAAHGEGRPAIVVGGTGLYLKVLIEGVAAIPPIPSAVRSAARALLDAVGSRELHRRLAARDPAGAARIPPGNGQRLARAWEVLEATGTPLSVWQEAPPRPVLPARFFSVHVAPPRTAVVEAAAARFRSMLAAGALDEVAAALAAGVSEDAPAMNALGARELAGHVRGRIGLAEAAELAEVATRRYAKRQATWFRHQFNSSLTLEARYTEAARDAVVPRVEDFLGESP